jgi:glycosyltransferase involved in cell wall biosynthesis
LDARPDISVILPAHNESCRIAPSIASIARARTTGQRVEFIVVDDASSDGCIANLIAVVPELLEEPEIDIRVSRIDERSGVYRTRNLGASLASAEVLVMTDAHVRFSRGWDELVLEHLQPRWILCGTTTEDGTDFHGYGCELLVPFMGTRWNEDSPGELAAVQVAPCHATVIPRLLFEQLGGYDPGMLYYGGGEPEFSLRAWLHGAEIRQLSTLEVEHHFRAEEEVPAFLAGMRRYTVHNRIRFGLLYLSEAGCMQLLGYYSRAYPAQFQTAMRMINASDVWERRELLEAEREYPFEWFVSRFGLRNQIAGEII